MSLYGYGMTQYVVEFSLGIPTSYAGIIMSIRLSKDNHDSWGTCTTSAECKTVIIAMLMVMSGMDHDMIS
jgi:hypothetical protein